MVNKIKSPRNQTLELTEGDRKSFSKRLKHFKGQNFDLKEIENCTIVGDVISVLPSLPAESVNLVIVDPPYNLNKDFNENQFKKMKPEDYEVWVESWLSLLPRIMKKNASIYICCDWQSSSAIYNVMTKYFQIKNRITWEREKGRGSKTNWKNNSEDIWFGTLSKDYYFDAESIKVKKKVIAPYRDEAGAPKDWKLEDGGNYRLTHASNLWTDITIPFWSMPENTEHPTQKPEKLIAKLILASSSNDDLIFDPFLGSGTTSVVAKKLNRKYLGVEIDKKYAALAEKRLQIAESSSDIQGYSGSYFWERNSLPNQKKSRNISNNLQSTFFDDNIK